MVALIDPAVERAQAVLQKKCDSFVVSAYQNTRIYKSLDDYASAVANTNERPHAFAIGSPPMFRGSIKAGRDVESGRDVELQILKHFPGVPLFIEKPVATGTEEEIKDAYVVAKAIKDSNAICSVGYVSARA